MRKGVRRTTQGTTKADRTPVTHDESVARKQRFLALVRGDEAAEDAEALPLSVAGACRVIDIHPNTVRMWRKTDQAFASDYTDAIEFGTDIIEDQATRRATLGVDEPVYQGGELVGVKRVFSDRLMEFILIGRRPEKFGRTAGQTNVNILQVEEPTNRDIAKAFSLLLEEQKKAPVDG